MLALIIAPFFIAFEVLLFYKVLKYLNKFKVKHQLVLPIIFAILLLLGLVTTLIAFLLASTHPLKRSLTSFSFYWFGFFLYFVLGIIFSLIIRQIIFHFKKENYRKDFIVQHSIVFIIIFTLIMGVYGCVNAHDLKVNDYVMAVNKKADINKLKIAFIADLHLGYNVGTNEVEDIVNTINKLKPDLIIIGGDIFDNQYEAIEDPQEITNLLSSLKSKYGCYAVLGNHDVEEKILMGFTFPQSEHNISKDMLAFIEDSNIKLLYDDYIEIEGIQIYGRPDASKYNLNNSSRLNSSEIVAQLDINKPIIVIDHEPKELDELSADGIDVDLCGHTHAGQIWPVTWLNDLLWVNAVGYQNINGMHNIVTSGVGLFGINMRTFTDAEICNITIYFTQD